MEEKATSASPLAYRRIRSVGAWAGLFVFMTTNQWGHGEGYRPPPPINFRRAVSFGRTGFFWGGALKVKGAEEMKLPGTGKKGGLRNPSGGRPKQIRNYSEEVRSDFLKAAKSKAKETGRSLGRVVVDIIYDETVQDSVRIGALKAWCDVVVIKEPKHIVEKEEFRGPTIFLPAIKD